MATNLNNRARYEIQMAILDFGTKKFFCQTLRAAQIKFVTDCWRGLTEFADRRNFRHE